MHARAPAVECHGCRATRRAPAIFFQGPPHPSGQPRGIRRVGAMVPTAYGVGTMKKITAFTALALLGSLAVALPVGAATEATVLVGGQQMFPNKDIVDN